MSTKTRKPRAKKAHAEEVAETVRAVTDELVEPFEGLDLIESCEADDIRRVTGLVVALGGRWGKVHPRIVSMLSDEGKVFVAEANRGQLAAYMAEQSQTAPIRRFEELPKGHKRAAKVAAVLESLRGDGQGGLRWGTPDDVHTFSLAGASVDDTRKAFGAVFDWMADKPNDWILDDLDNATRLLEADHVTDANIQHCEKKTLACGLQQLLADHASNRLESGKLLGKLASMMKSVETLAGSVAKKKTSLKDTSKSRKLPTK